MSVLVPGGAGSAPGWRVWWSWRCPWRSTVPQQTAGRCWSAPAPFLVNPERSTPRWSTPTSAARSARAPWTEPATPAAASTTWTQEHTGVIWVIHSAYTGKCLGDFLNHIFHFSTVPNPIPPTSASSLIPSSSDSLCPDPACRCFHSVQRCRSCSVAPPIWLPVEPRLVRAPSNRSKVLVIWATVL